MTQQISKKDGLAIAGDDSFWVVKTTSDTFRLNDAQIRALKDAGTSGKTKMVWFKNYAIPLNRIVSVKLEPRVKSCL